MKSETYKRYFLLSLMTIGNTQPTYNQNCNYENQIPCKNLSLSGTRNTFLLPSLQNLGYFRILDIGLDWHPFFFIYIYLSTHWLKNG